MGKIIIIALVLLSVSANAQVLWQGATVGMSVQEVLTVVPHAIKVDKGGTLYGGARELVRVPRIEVSSNQFRAEFFFVDGKLTQVTLKLDEQLNYIAAHIIFEELVDLLRAKYGKELSLREQNGPMSESGAEWISGKTNISLTMVLIANMPAILNVNYQVRVSGETDKL
ncbi:MAG: hypothetical protein WAN51_00885 [Alphaproteobacteria bacterium]